MREYDSNSTDGVHVIVFLERVEVVSQRAKQQQWNRSVMN